MREKGETFVELHMSGGVMVEFSSGKKFSPFLRVIGAKDSEIGFDLLIGLLSLSVHLSGGKVDIIVV